MSPHPSGKAAALPGGGRRPASPSRVRPPHANGAPGAHQATIDAAAYDPCAHLNQIFPTAKLLLDLPQVANALASHRLELQQRLETRMEQFRETSTTADGQPLPVRLQLVQDVALLVTKIQLTQTRLTETATRIDKMTSKIKQLDDVKKRLMLTMNVLKRLQMLAVSYGQLEQVVKEHAQLAGDDSGTVPLDYRGVYHTLDATLLLMEYFRPYKLIDSIAHLLKQIDGLKHTIILQVFVDFDHVLVKTRRKLLEPTVDTLYHACLVLELVDAQLVPNHHTYRGKLIDWYTSLQLKDILEIFKPLDEAGLLENLTRRFMYFRRILVDTHYGAQHDRLFPATWHVGFRLAQEFVDTTCRDVKQVLASSASTKHVDLLLTLLQELMAFEKYLMDYFSHKRVAEGVPEVAAEGEDPEVVPPPVTNLKLLSVFEPYLQLWVQLQEPLLSSKFNEFLAAPKDPKAQHHRERVASPAANGSTANGSAAAGVPDKVPHVIPSLAELFRVYKHLLTQLERFNIKLFQFFVDLQQLFRKYLSRYLNEVLVPVLPTTVQVLMDQQSLYYLTLVLNTAEYCISTMDQLEERLLKLGEQQLQAIHQELLEDDIATRAAVILFDDIKGFYTGFMGKTISMVLEHVDQLLDLSWREMLNNPQWRPLGSHKTETGGGEYDGAPPDVLRYATNIAKTLEQECREILPLVIREVYVGTVCDRMCEHVVKRFLQQVVRLKPINVEMGEQLMLDLHYLKDAMALLPKYRSRDFGAKGTGGLVPLRVGTPLVDAELDSEFGGDSSDGGPSAAARAAASRKDARFREHVNRMVSAVNLVLKLTVAPIVEGEEETFINTYFLLIKDQSDGNFAKVLDLKGILPNVLVNIKLTKQRYQFMMETFARFKRENAKYLNENMAGGGSHTALQQLDMQPPRLEPQANNTRRLADLFSQSLSLTAIPLPWGGGLLAVLPLPVQQPTMSPDANSFEQSLGNIQQAMAETHKKNMMGLEKNFKEIEGNVSRVGEGFRNFGSRLFNRD